MDTIHNPAQWSNILKLWSLHLIFRLSVSGKESFQTHNHWLSMSKFKHCLTRNIYLFKGFLLVITNLINTYLNEYQIWGYIRPYCKDHQGGIIIMTPYWNQSNFHCIDMCNTKDHLSFLWQKMMNLFQKCDSNFITWSIPVTHLQSAFHWAADVNE